MIKLIAPAVAPGKKKWEEKTKRGGYFTTQSGWWRDDNVLSLKGFFHSPPIPLCSHCCFSDSPRNWFQIWKTLSFQRNGLMQVIRLGANFFQGSWHVSLSHYVSLPVLQSHTQRECGNTAPAPTGAIQPKLCPGLLFPLLSWNDINLHTSIQNIRSRNWFKWKLILFSLETYTEPVLTLQTHKHKPNWGGRNEHLQHSDVSHWLPSPLTNPLER